MPMKRLRVWLKKQVCDKTAGYRVVEERKNLAGDCLVQTDAKRFMVRIWIAVAATHLR